MTPLPLRAALLAGALGMVATPGSAQRVPAATPAARPATGDGEAIVTVPPEPTSARIVAPVSTTPADPRRPRPTYLPDAGYPDDVPPLPAGAIATLGDAIVLAYRTNPDLLSARAQARSLDFRVPQARAAYGPTLSATGGYTFTRTRYEARAGVFTPSQGWTSTASLILTQPLFTFGRNAAAEAGALATSDYYRMVLRSAEVRALNDVVTVYVSVLRDAAAVTIARENLALLDRQYGDNQTRYNVRELTQTDLQQTQTRVELARAQLLLAEGQLGASQKDFLRYVGAPPGELAPPDRLDVGFGSLAAAYAYGEANSPLVRAAQAREKISRAAVAAARAESRPRIDLRGTADYGTVSPYSDALRTTQLVGQVVLSQPIIDSGLRRARTDEAREANQSDWRLIDAAYREVRGTIGSAWDQLAATRASLASYRAAIEAARLAYEGAVIQQKAGDRTTLDVLDLARDLLTVRNSYNAAIANEYLARSSLLAAAGVLEGPLIVPGLTPYDPDAHFDVARRRSDIPLVTPALSALDGIVNPDNRRDRPSRDAGAAQALDAALPLPPPDPAPAR